MADAPTPYNAPLPGAATAAQGALLANTAYQKALAALNQKRMSLLHQYGYQGSVDDKTGTVSNVHVDPYNPYGAFQSLLNSSAQSSEDAVNQAEGRGLHGGLAHQLARAVQQQHGAQSQALGTELTNSLSDYETQQESAGITRDQALYQAELDNARNAIAAGDYPTAQQPDTPPPAAPPSTTTTTTTADPRQRLIDWLGGQAAAAGQYRQNKPQGMRGVYVQ